MLAKIQFYKSLVVLCFLASSVLAQTEASMSEGTSAVKVELALANGKTVYQPGEPIKLILSFTATGAGYQLDTTTTRPASPIDEILLTPEAKAFHWLEIYSGAERYRPDYVSITELSTAPTTIELYLNDWYRFDRPGRFTVKIKTERVRAPKPGVQERFDSGASISLLTNEVSFEIKATSGADEQAEVQRLAFLMAATKNRAAQSDYVVRFAFLTNDAATREKVKLFLDSQNVTPSYYSPDVTLGLYIAKNKNLAIELLEKALADTATPVTRQLIFMLVGLRRMRDEERQNKRFVVPADPKLAYQAEEKSRAEIERFYIGKLLATLSRRSGQSLSTTAVTILLSLRPADAQYAEDLATVRALILKNFENLSLAFTQEYLLNYYWEQLRDPSLLPILEKILRDTHGVYSLNVRGTALRRLFDLNPERARPFYIEEIKDPVSLVELDVLGRLPDQTLPETDAALLEQISDYSQKNEPTYLHNKTMRAARYASPAIYDELLNVYQADSAKWQIDSKAYLLAYLARSNEQKTLPLIEKQLTGLPFGTPGSFLHYLTEYYFSDGVNELLIKLLNGDDPDLISAAAYVLGDHGPATDVPLLRARLARWRTEWGGRINEIESPASDRRVRYQSSAEREIILALIHGKNWKLPASEITELKRGCLTKACRSNFPNS